MVELPVGRMLPPYKWVYWYKYVLFGSERPKYKASLVTKGFKQEHGVDYDEIFSPVVKMTMLRLLPVVVATEDLELEQLDLDGDIYGDRPTSNYVANFRLLACDIPWEEEALMDQLWQGICNDVKDLLFTLRLVEFYDVTTVYSK